MENICEIDVVEKESGYLVSPNFPLPYGNSLNCSTIINPKPGMVST